MSSHAWLGKDVEDTARITSWLNDIEARVSAASRDSALTTGEGFIAQSFSRFYGSTVTVTTGDVRGSLVSLKAGDVISKVGLWVATAGVGMSKGQLALYSTTGTLLASSADSPSSFQSANTFVNLAMTTPYVVPADTLAYACWFLTTGTSMPAISVGTQSFTNYYQALNSGLRKAVAQTGQASLPSPATFGDSSVLSWMTVA